MPQIYTQRPKQQSSGGGNNPLGSFLSLGGAALGALTAGPGGSLAGASAGAGLGGLLGGAISQPQAQNTQQQGPAQIDSAMQRRVTQLDQTPLKQIRDSIDSLKFVDQSTRAELAKPLLQAEYLAKQQGQV